MNNYTPVSFDYNNIKILNAINDYTEYGARSCTKQEVDEINDILNLKYRAYAMLYFNLPPKRSAQIHIDEDSLNEKTTLFKFALNLPLLNADKTKMNWWKKKKASIKDEYKIGVAYAKYKILQLENAKCIDSVFYEQTMLVDIYNYHNVENTTDNPSHFISLRFDDDITKEMIIDSLSI